MNNLQIESLCKEKEQELIDKYFGNLVKEAAVDRPETIGDYAPDLPLRIEAEYKEFLEKLWKEYAGELLFVMHEDFMEEITGHEIENKAFDDN